MATARDSEASFSVDARRDGRRIGSRDVRWGGGLRRLGGRSIVILFAAFALAGCDSTPRGRLMLTYEWITPQGVPLQCSELGATQMELSLFHLPGDVLPYHRVALACETSEEGEGRQLFTLDAHDYSRLEVRLLSYGGTTVRLCRGTETIDARLVQEPFLLRAGETLQVHWRLEGTPGSCADPP